MRTFNETQIPFWINKLKCGKNSFNIRWRGKWNVSQKTTPRSEVGHQIPLRKLWKRLNSSRDLNAYAYGIEISTIKRLKIFRMKLVIFSAISKIWHQINDVGSKLPLDEHKRYTRFQTIDIATYVRAMFLILMFVCTRRLYISIYILQ